jgi:hypothetical protein
MFCFSGNRFNKINYIFSILDLYWALGPQLDLDPNILVGWERCYINLYSIVLHGAELDTILNNCNKTNLLMACSMVNASKFAVAAMASRIDVTHEAVNVTESRAANGAVWYFDANSGWGFARVGDPMDKTYCDITFGDTEDFRLCWHTVAGYDGFRCGKAYFNLSTNYYPYQWNRIVYHAD